MNRKNICEICTLIMGQSPDSKSYNKDKNGIPFYQGNADFGEEHPTPTVWCTAPKKIARKGDILISVRAPIGDMNIANEDCCIGRGLAAIRLNKSDIVDINYLYHYLSATVEFLQEQGTGSTFKAINKTTLEGIEIPCPSIEKQKNIAKLIIEIKTSIQYKKAELFALNELVKSRFIEMFGDPETNPNGWEQVTVGDVCSSIVRGPFGSALKKEFFVEPSDTAYKVYEQKHAIQKSATIGTYYVTEEKFKELKRFECVPGDILMSCSGTMGELFQLPNDCERGIINQALCKFTLNEKMLPICFLTYMKQTIGNLETKGSGIQNIAAVSYVKAMPINLPPMEVQFEFENFCKLIDKSKFIVQKQIDDLQELLDSKMDEYFG